MASLSAHTVRGFFPTLSQPLGDPAPRPVGDQPVGAADRRAHRRSTLIHKETNRSNKYTDFSADRGGLQRTGCPEHYDARFLGIVAYVRTA